jgi:hypothetical protein
MTDDCVQWLTDYFTNNMITDLTKWLILCETLCLHVCVCMYICDKLFPFCPNHVPPPPPIHRWWAGECVAFVSCQQPYVSLIFIEFCGVVLYIHACAYLLKTPCILAAGMRMHVCIIDNQSDRFIISTDACMNACRHACTCVPELIVSITPKTAAGAFTYLANQIMFQNIISNVYVLFAHPQCSNGSLHESHGFLDRSRQHLHDSWCCGWLDQWSAPRRHCSAMGLATAGQGHCSGAQRSPG